MNGIKERADRIAGWILRREGMLKSARLPKVLADMLTEQRTADIEKAWKWLTTEFPNMRLCEEDFRKAMED